MFYFLCIFSYNKRERMNWNWSFFSHLNCIVIVLVCLFLGDECFFLWIDQNRIRHRNYSYWICLKMCSVWTWMSWSCWKNLFKRKMEYTINYLNFMKHFYETQTFFACIGWNFLSTCAPFLHIHEMIVMIQYFTLSSN